MRAKRADPALTARESIVYAVYEEENGTTGTRLYYRQLAPDFASLGAISRHHPHMRTILNPTLAISPAGSLHVVWKGDQIYYADNLNTTGDMSIKWNLVTPVSSSPKIAIDEGDVGMTPCSILPMPIRPRPIDVLNLFSFPVLRLTLIKSGQG